MGTAQNLIESDEEIGELLAQTRRIAVLGIKTEKHADQAAYYVAEYLVSAGLDVILANGATAKLADCSSILFTLNALHKCESISPVSQAAGRR